MNQVNSFNWTCADCGTRYDTHHYSDCPRFVKAAKTPDAINPSHYRQGGIECIDAIQSALTPEEYRGFLKGQIMRYGWRLGLKDDPQQEAGKLLWYAQRLKDFLSEGA